MKAGLVLMMLASINASRVLALGMATIYVRDVPEDVAAQLAAVAKAQKTSVQALALQELTAFARRSRNRVILDALPKFHLDRETILADIAEGRDS